MDENENLEEEGSIPSKQAPKIKWGAIIAGFLGWFIVNTLIWSIANESNDYLCLFIPFPSNIIIFIILVVKRPWRPIAWGMLSAVALNLMISLILGAGGQALCFYPFLLDGW